MHFKLELSITLIVKSNPEDSAAQKQDHQRLQYPEPCCRRYREQHHTGKYTRREQHEGYELRGGLIVTQEQKFSHRAACAKQERPQQDRPQPGKDERFASVLGVSAHGR